MIDSRGKARFYLITVVVALVVFVLFAVLMYMSPVFGGPLSSIYKKTANLKSGVDHKSLELPGEMVYSSDLLGGCYNMGQGFSAHTTCEYVFAKYYVGTDELGHDLMGSHEYLVSQEFRLIPKSSSSKSIWEPNDPIDWLDGSELEKFLYSMYSPISEEKGLIVYLVRFDKTTLQEGFGTITYFAPAREVIKSAAQAAQKELIDNQYIYGFVYRRFIPARGGYTIKEARELEGVEPIGSLK